MKKKKILNIITIISAVLILAAAVYIMVNGLGLNENLDFGAGAYYYADIPNFGSYVDSGAYTSKTPMWLLILLFLAWGALMYRLWVWIEKRGQKKEKKA